MCFSIPLKVIKVGRKYLTLETGEKVMYGKEIVKKGYFVQRKGNFVDKILNEKEALNIRNIIKNLDEDII